jgi:hypothetical protein
MADRLHEDARVYDDLRCLACGARIEPTLVHVGSLRCLGCRDADRPLDPALAGQSPGRRPLVNWLAGVRALGRWTGRS